MADIYSQDNHIMIPFPEGKYKKYLQEAGVENEKSVTPSQVKDVFYIVVKDFLSGGCSTDDVSEIAGQLVQLLGKNTHREEHKELFETLDAAAEMGFYVRMKDLKIFSSILASTLAFVGR